MPGAFSLQKMNEPVPPPKFPYIEVSTRCNLRCRICGQVLYDAPKEDMPLDTFNRLEHLFEHSEEVKLYGSGEPFLNPDYFEMIKRVKAPGNRISIITNGTLLGDDACTKIVEEGVDILTVSIDGARPETFNYIRRGADFHKVIGNVRRLVRKKEEMGKKNPYIAINFVVTQLNLPELPEMVRLANNLKVDGILAVELIDWDMIKDEKLKPPGKGLKYIRRAERLARKLNVKLEIQPNLVREIKSLNKKPGARRHSPAVSKLPRRRLCTQPWDSVQIDFNGDVRPCCWPSRVLGNIHREDFPDIWNGLLYNEFRRLLRSGHPPEECLKCTAMPWSDTIPATLNIKKVVSGQLGQGWHDMETSPQGIYFRWMGKKASFYLRNIGKRKLCLKLFSNSACMNPDLHVDMLVNGNAVQAISVKNDKLHEVCINLPQLTPELLEVELFTENTFVPAMDIPGSSDERELSLALCAVRFA